MSIDGKGLNKNLFTDLMYRNLYPIKKKVVKKMLSLCQMFVNLKILPVAVAILYKSKKNVKRD